MRKASLLTAAASLSLGFAPLSAIAAPATTDIQEEDVLNVMEGESSMDRGGGGGEYYYPGPYGGGISVDVTLTKEITPDSVAVSAYCEASDFETRGEVREELTRIYKAIKDGVGSDGRVRRSGSPGVYPYYDPYGGASNHYSGSVNILIKLTKVSAALRIEELISNNSCSSSWDVRLIDTEDFELDNLDTLLAKLNKRKAVYEKLLKKKLTKVTGASLYTWVDGYSSYDPETNKADATITLTVTFEAGSTRTTRAVPME